MNSSQKLILSDLPMRYWINITKRRIIIVAHVANSVYFSAYLGSAIRFASQSAYPKPQVVIGTTTGFLNYGSTSTFGVLNRGGTNILFFDYGGNYKSTGFYASRELFLTDRTLRKNDNDEVCLFPIFLFFYTGQDDAYYSHIIYFQLDGVYMSPCTGILSEDTINTSDFIVFQDVYRLNWYDYFAISGA